MLNHECFSHTNYSIRLYFTNKAGRFPPKVKFLCSIQCFQSKCPRENVNFSISFQNQHYRFKKIKIFGLIDQSDEKPDFDFVNAAEY